jgi:hypothetical protein
MKVKVRIKGTSTEVTKKNFDFFQRIFSYKNMVVTPRKIHSKSLKSIMPKIWLSAIKNTELGYDKASVLDDDYLDWFKSIMKEYKIIDDDPYNVELYSSCKTEEELDNIELLSNFANKIDAMAKLQHISNRNKLDKTDIFRTMDYYFKLDDDFYRVIQTCGRQGAYDMFLLLNKEPTISYVKILSRNEYVNLTHKK